MKVLVIQQKMIGDVLTSSILFEALRKEMPEAELHFLIYQHTSPVVANNPNIDKLVLFDPEKDQTIRGFVALLKKVRQQHYDVVIDVYSKINTALITACSGAAKRISYKKWYTKKAYTRTFDHKTLLQTDAGFAIENRMQLLQGISADFPPTLRPRIWLTKAEKDAAKQLLLNSGVTLDEPLIMCGILGSSSLKTYPLEYMAQVLDFVVQKTGAQLLFNYIPKQREQAMELLTFCKRETRKKVFPEVSGGNLREFIAITSQCNALIGNEGGAINMAKAVDVPTFSVFSPQIKKENWSLFEDGKRHVSVHLSDFYPEIFEDLSPKEIVKKSSGFYDRFKPNLIFAPLEQFLKQNCLDQLIEPKQES